MSMPRTRTEKAIQRDTLKNIIDKFIFMFILYISICISKFIIDKSKWNSWKDLSNPKESKRKKTEWTEKTNKRKKITNLCPNTSAIALSIYGLNIPIKAISRVEKNNSKLIHCLQETHFIYNGVSWK